MRRAAIACACRDPRRPVRGRDRQHRRRHGGRRPGRLAFEVRPGERDAHHDGCRKDLPRRRRGRRRSMSARDWRAGATLEWLPQETILFDARVRAPLEVDLAADTDLLLVESLVFGRLAMGETVASGRLEIAGGCGATAGSSSPRSWRSRRCRGPARPAGARAPARGHPPRSSSSRRAAEKLVDGPGGKRSNGRCTAGASAWNGCSRPGHLALARAIARRYRVAVAGLAGPRRATPLDLMNGPGHESTPREKDKLLIAMAAKVARRRLERASSSTIQKPLRSSPISWWRGARRAQRRRTDGAGSHVLTPVR